MPLYAVMVLTVWEAVQNQPVQRTFWDVVIQAGGVLTALGVIATAFAWPIKKWAWPGFKRWLTRELLVPIRETHHSVTVNGGKSEPPTLRDDFSELRADVAEVRSDVAEVRSDMAGLITSLAADEHRLTEHEESSHKIISQIWTAIQRIEPDGDEK